MTFIAKNLSETARSTGTKTWPEGLEAFKYATALAGTGLAYNECIGGPGNGGRIFIRPGTSLAEAATLAGISVADLLSYNPGIAEGIQQCRDPATITLGTCLLYTSGIRVGAGDGLYQTAEKLLKQQLDHTPNPQEIHAAASMLKMWNPQLASTEPYPPVQAGTMLSVDLPDLARLSSYPTGIWDGLDKAWAALKTDLGAKTVETLITVMIGAIGIGGLLAFLSGPAGAAAIVPLVQAGLLAYGITWSIEQIGTLLGFLWDSANGNLSDSEIRTQGQAINLPKIVIGTAAVAAGTYSAVKGGGGPATLPGKSTNTASATPVTTIHMVNNNGVWQAPGQGAVVPSQAQPPAIYNPTAMPATTSPNPAIGAGATTALPTGEAESLPTQSRQPFYMVQRPNRGIQYSRHLPEEMGGVPPTPLASLVSETMVADMAAAVKNTRFANANSVRPILLAQAPKLTSPEHVLQFTSDFYTKICALSDPRVYQAFCNDPISVGGNIPYALVHSGGVKSIHMARAPEVIPDPKNGGTYTQYNMSVIVPNAFPNNDQELRVTFNIREDGTVRDAPKVFDVDIYPSEFPVDRIIPYRQREWDYPAASPTSYTLEDFQTLSGLPFRAAQPD